MGIPGRENSLCKSREVVTSMRTVKSFRMVGTQGSGVSGVYEGPLQWLFMDYIHYI